MKLGDLMMGNLAKDNEQVSRLIIADERPFLSYLADNVLYLDKSQEWALYYTIMHIFFKMLHRFSLNHYLHHF